MRVSKRISIAIGTAAVAAASIVSAQDYSVPADAPAYIRAAVESSERPAADTERDAARKPAEVLALSGIEPGDRVIEIAALGLYYTRMLSNIVGADGNVDIFDLPYTAQFVGDAPQQFADTHPNTEYHLGDYNTAEFPGDVDVVFNILYYHDLGLQEIDTAAMNAKLLAALKPGGIYLIIDHKAEDGSGWRDVETLHRMDTQVIVEELTAAGFELVVDSDLLANPDDPRDAMVFAPGTRGATDRALYVFRKPD